jgi:acetyl esterase/lipase
VQAVLRNGLRHRVKAMAALAGPFDFLPLDSPKTMAAFGDVADLEETQPVLADLSDAPPLLLLHGRDDETVGLHNSWNLHAAYARAGRMSQLKFYDGIGHVGIMLALARPLRYRAPVLEDLSAFLHKYC